MQLIIDIGNTQPKYPINLTVYPDGKALMTSGAEVHEVGVKTIGEHGELIDRKVLEEHQIAEIKAITGSEDYDPKARDMEIMLRKGLIYEIRQETVVMEATR